VIEGIFDGATYKANKKEIIVKDAYLASATVNGTQYPVVNGEAKIPLVCDQTTKNFFIVGEDCAGHFTTARVTLQQESGDDTGAEDDPYYNPDDDMIQDDTDDAEDSDAGTLTKKVQLVDGAPATTFTSTNKELKSYVLSSSERNVLKEGSDANVKLRVANIDGSVSQADKELVIAALGDYTVAQYIDITLWKKVGSGEEHQVSQTKSPISVTVTIPASIRRSPKTGKVRQFAFVRVHKGSATVLEDKDSSANTITIGTSRFSVYALAYRDVDASKVKKNSSSGGGHADSGGSGSGSGGSGGGGSSSGGSGGGGGRSSGLSVETDGIIDGTPQTGDRAPVLPTAIGFGVALIGMITAIIIRRKMDYEWVYVGEDGRYYDESGHLIDDDEIIEMN
ncbi:MAG: LPXTG cell wall anchor domain-containing protein, partial [Eubacterium sp.]|nr:LPXTG cell wall anchor domain-containing protein [Eubacterium sp.]